MLRFLSFSLHNPTDDGLAIANISLIYYWSSSFDLASGVLGVINLSRHSAEWFGTFVSADDKPR